MMTLSGMMENHLVKGDRATSGKFPATETVSKSLIGANLPSGKQKTPRPQGLRVKLCIRCDWTFPEPRESASKQAQ
jgi:hypothetical protein